jgi:hypothetical protein
VAELLGALGVIITLAYLAVQIRQNTKLVSASLAGAAREAASELTRILATDSNATRIFWSGLADRSSLAERDRQQFDALITLTFWADRQQFMLGQWEDLHTFEWMLGSQGVREWWAVYSPIFTGPFRDYVEQRLKETPPTA